MSGKSLSLLSFCAPAPVCPVRLGMFVQQRMNQPPLCISKFRYPREKFDNVRTASDKERADTTVARAILILCVPHHRTTATAHSPSLLLVELECFEFVNPLFLSIPHSFVEISSPGCSAGSALNRLVVELWSGRRTMMFIPGECSNKKDSFTLL